MKLGDLLVNLKNITENRRNTLTNLKSQISITNNI